MGRISALVSQTSLPPRGNRGQRHEMLAVFSGKVYQVILLHQKLLQFDWLRAVVFQLNLKYLHVKITNLAWIVV